MCGGMLGGASLDLHMLFLSVTPLKDMRGVGGGGQLVTVIREVTPGPVKMD